MNQQVANLAGNKIIALKKLVQKIRQKKGIGSMTGYTSEFMNQLNHSHYFFSDRDTLQEGWDHLKPLFMFILQN